MASLSTVYVLSLILASLSAVGSVYLAQKVLPTETPEQPVAEPDNLQSELQLPSEVSEPVQE